MFLLEIYFLFLIMNYVILVIRVHAPLKSTTILKRTFNYKVRHAMFKVLKFMFVYQKVLIRTFHISFLTKK